MRPEGWAIIIPVLIVAALFLMSDAGQSVIVSFTTAIPHVGGLVLFGVMVVLIISGLFYVIVVLGFAMAFAAAIAGMVMGGSDNDNGPQ